MPVSPLGGLSFMFNVFLVLMGALMDFLTRMGFSLRPIWRFFAVFTSKKFDRPWRKALGYGIMVTIFSFLLVSTIFSFERRFREPTNLTFIMDSMDHLYQTDNAYSDVAFAKILYGN